MRQIIRTISLLVFISALPAVPASALTPAGPATSPNQGLRVSTDIGGAVKVNSVARMLAGMAPSYPGHFGIAETQTWKEHSAAMRTAWSQVSGNRVAAMSAWRDTAINSTCPSGKTLLYPFSGPDFFNAYWLFPDCENYVLFGLEHIGEVPEIEGVAERDTGRLLSDVRASMSDLLDRNYFITENMSRQLFTAQLRGVTPLLIIPMALSEVEILRIVPHDLPRQVRSRGEATRGEFVRGEAMPNAAATGESPAATASGAAPATVKKITKAQRGPIRQLNGITIEFRKPGSTTIQRLHYFTLDATDNGLEHYPEFITFINGLAPTSTFLKAASYLLHGREFRKLRTTLLNVSEFLVQDDTGLPFWTLQPKRWDIRLYGKYETPIPPFERTFQSTLDKAYRAVRPAPLPFEFGYSYSDKRDNRSNVLVGRKTVLKLPEPVARETPARTTKRVAMTRGSASASTVRK